MALSGVARSRGPRLDSGKDQARPIPGLLEVLTLNPLIAGVVSTMKRVGQIVQHIVVPISQDRQNCATLAPRCYNHRHPQSLGGKLGGDKVATFLSTHNPRNRQGRRWECSNILRLHNGAHHPWA